MENTIKNLIAELNAASQSYYNGMETMSNNEWDAKFDKLKALEKETGIILAESPTQSVGYAPKVGTRITHEFPARSLDKTKEVSLLQQKMASQQAVLLMWKLDGSTLQLTYNGGKLQIAATRGNGEVGQDITANAPYILGIPQRIKHKEKLVIRGEALMSYADFETVNASLSQEEQYANPRNLANATISMLDPLQVQKRSIHFKVFGIVHIEGEDIPEFDKRMLWLNNQGFDTVEWALTTPEDLEKNIEDFTNRVQDYPYPVDGLVVASNDIARCEKLPGTGHHPNVLAGYAFKWADTKAKTTLRSIEWSPSRTGLLNPVAIFDPVELEGTVVSRASLHNFSYVRDKHLRIGDSITVYKANMIIPQIAENESDNKATYSDDEVADMIPLCCVCGQKASIHTINDVETMHCDNPICAAKKIGRFVHFCQRDCMDIEGMSEATITKFVEKGFLHFLRDIYKLTDHKLEIIEMEGFGEKSWDNMQKAIEDSKKRDIVRLLTALGIPNIGKGQAKQIAEHFDGDAKTTLDYIFGEEYDFTLIDGVGAVINESIHSFAKESKEDDSFVGDLLQYIDVQNIQVSKNQDSSIAGKTFVITGSLEQYANRNEMKAEIESLGGKVTGSVTSKTDYLINNDVNSTSGKNKKAKELGVSIISEADYKNLINQ